MLTRRMFNALALLFGAGGCSPGKTSAPPPPDLRKLPFKHMVTSGANALAEWERLRALGEGYPIIVGDDDNLRGLIETYTFAKPHDPEKILRRAQNIDHQQQLAKDKAESDAAGAAHAKQHGYELDPEEEPEMGEWPAEEGGGGGGFGPTLAYASLSTKPLERVHILLIPAKHGWEVPAYLGFGDFNSCPSPDIHVAALRDWERRYGAELVALSHDVIELRVKRRPADREAAVKLALEQYRYCADIVDQGTGDIASLAFTLLHGDWWYFWWD